MNGRHDAATNVILQVCGLSDLITNVEPKRRYACHRGTTRPVARNPTNKRSRHIGYRLQFVRDAVDYLQTRPHYVGTASQPADLLTKPGTAASLDIYGDLLSGIGTCPQTRQLFPGIGA